jgi:hypothetical protein
LRRAGRVAQQVAPADDPDAPLLLVEQGIGAVVAGGQRVARLSLHLARIEGIDVPPGDAECPSLRGRACRPYEPLANESP